MKENRNITSSVADRIGLDLHTALKNVSELDLLQRLIDQNYQRFTSENRETVRFPYSERVGNKRVSKTYSVIDADGKKHLVTLSHSISGEINSAEGGVINISFHVEGHYSKAGERGKRSDEAIGAGAYGNVRRVLWSFQFKNNAEKLEISNDVTPRVVKRVRTTVIRPTVILGPLGQHVISEVIPISANEVQNERDYFQLAYPNEKISGVFHPSSPGKSARFIMPKLGGETVQNVLDVGGKLTLSKTVAIAKALLEAVQDLHEKNIAHGDIHLGNALLGKDGKINFVDFGFSSRTNSGLHVDQAMYKDRGKRDDIQRLTVGFHRLFKIAIERSSGSNERRFLKKIINTLEKKLSQLDRNYDSKRLDEIIFYLGNVISDLNKNELSRENNHTSVEFLSNQNFIDSSMELVKDIKKAALSSELRGASESLIALIESEINTAKSTNSPNGPYRPSAQIWSKRLDIVATLHKLSESSENKGTLSILLQKIMDFFRKIFGSKSELKKPNPTENFLKFFKASVETVQPSNEQGPASQPPRVGKSH